MRSYADGARPISTLFTRLLTRHRSPQYRITEPDRSVAADFSKADIRELYLRRAASSMKIELNKNEVVDLDALQLRLQMRIDHAQPVDERNLATSIEHYRTITRKLQANKAKVIYATLPVSGMLLDLGEKIFPRPRIWQPFAEQVGAGTIHFLDHAELRKFICPDGSHLDTTDRAPFTRALVKVAKARGLL